MTFFKDDITGSYYSLENGELIQYAMNKDGTMSKGTNGAVDWDFVLHELPLTVNGEEIDLYKHLKGIEAELGKGVR